MAKTKISEYSSTANSNTDIASINIDEGCAPSGINNAIRALMAQLKDFQTGAASDPVTVGGVLTVTGGSASAPAITTSGDTNTGVLFPAADTVGITTGGTERVRVDSAGNVGVGVTPSAWGTANSVKALQTPAGVLWNYTSGNLYLGQNYYFNGSNRIYLNNTAASEYQQNAGVHSWFTAPSGTAGNAITFTQAMTLDASGNLAIGNTSAAGRLEVKQSNTSRWWLENDASATNTKIVFANNAGSVNRGRLQASELYFQTAVGDAAIIDSSGNLLVGTTSRLSNSVTGIQADGGDWVTTFRTTNASGGGLCSFMQRTSSTGEFIAFRYGGGTGSGVGVISTNGTTTTYSTSSDYRLKENIAPMTGALAKIAALKPCTYTWKADGSAGEGFIAHELAEVVPEAVAGEKDAVNEDGSIKPQGIDTSFLVATLTAAIQEQQAIITQLQADVAALKGQ